MKEYERSGLAGVPDYRAAEFAPRRFPNQGKRFR